MSSLLFVMPGTPLIFNYSGAASRYAQNFLALQRLVDEVHVLRFHADGHLQAVLNFEESSEEAQRTHQLAASWQDVELPENRATSRLDVLRRMFFDPLAGEFPQHIFLAQAIQMRIQSLAPQFVWAEHSDAAAALWQASPDLPWVYSHHDMRYLIRIHRTVRRSLFDRIQAQFARRAEIRTIRSADVVLTGSLTERDRLMQLGCLNAECIPMIYPGLPAIELNHIAPDMHITHIGSLETTANRSGLISYLSLVHPVVLAETDIELVIIGDATRIKAPLSELLLQPRIVCKGYVPDLSTVLRPYDITILPYTQDSGYRTKLPLLMAYAQVIVATRASLVGSMIPGLEQVCILLDRLEDFPAKIAWLTSHPEERKRLGLAARAFVEQHFSLDTVLPLYEKLITASYFVR